MRLLRRRRVGSLSGGEASECAECHVCDSVILSTMLEVRGHHGLVTGGTPEFREIKATAPGPLLIKQQILDLNPDLSDLRTPNSQVWCILKLKACEAWRHRQELDLALAFEEVTDRKSRKTMKQSRGSVGK